MICLPSCVAAEECRSHTIGYLDECPMVKSIMPQAISVSRLSQGSSVSVFMKCGFVAGKKCHQLNLQQSWCCFGCFCHLSLRPPSCPVIGTTYNKFLMFEESWKTFQAAEWSWFSAQRECIADLHSRQAFFKCYWFYVLFVLCFDSLHWSWIFQSLAQ